MSALGWVAHTDAGEALPFQLSGENLTDYEVLALRTCGVKNVILKETNEPKFKIVGAVMCPRHAGRPVFKPILRASSQTR